MKNSKGSIVIGFIIISGMTIILLSGVLLSLKERTRSLRQIAAKYDAMELKSQIIAATSDNTTCNCLLKPANPLSPGNLWFDSAAAASGGSQEIVLTNISSACGVATPIATVGQFVSQDNSLLINKIAFTNLQPEVAGDPNSLNWTGEWRISFTPSPGIGAISPISFTQKFKINTASTPTQRVIDSCLGGSSTPDPFLSHFQSAELPLVGGATTTIPHGLPGRPHFVKISLVCINPTNGFSVGDELDPSILGEIHGAAYITITFDETNVYVTPYPAPGLYIVQKNGAYNTYSNYANWNFKVNAYSF